MMAAAVAGMISAAPAMVAQSQSWDEKFRAMPQAVNIKNNMQRLAAHPHHVGSPYSKENAEWMVAQFKAWGWDASIEQFDVLFPTPKERRLELVEPTRFTAKLDEPVVRSIPRAVRKPSNCRRTTRIRSTATSRRRSCTSTTGGSKTTSSSVAWASPLAALS
jgi:hypothetical protein